MKTSLIALVLVLLTTQCTNTETQTKYIDRVITEQVPAKLELAKYPEAHSYVAEQVELCGGGVIDGAKDKEGKALENRCGFTFKVDEEFIANLQMRNGLLHDENWAFKEGVTFYQAPIDTVIPEKYNLLDFMKNGKPDIRQQACGDCWAWATHHAVEINRAVHDGKVVDHSSQTVLSCSRKGSCSGGYMSAPDFLVGRGLPYESDFGYTGRNTKCKFSDSEMDAGKWDGKVLSAPYVGNSLQYSRYRLVQDGGYAGTKIQDMQRAMVANKAPLVVTVASFGVSGSGAVSSCSAVNSGGNHMVDISGWDTENGVLNAHVYNSHGKGFGVEGIGRIKWECGEDKLNRGLGKSARVVQYKSPCTPPNPIIGASQYTIFKGSSVKLGSAQPWDTKCKWSPAIGISDPNQCEVYASPEKSTEYHLTVTNTCGEASAMTLVSVLGPLNKYESDDIITPFGMVSRKEVDRYGK